MNTHTKMSSRGQVVIPKDMRDRHGWVRGSTFEVIDTPEGVLLKLPHKKGKLTVDEAIARIRVRVKYDGPPVSIEDMNESIDEMFRSAKDERF